MSVPKLLPACAAIVFLTFTAFVARADVAPDFGSLDGVPLGASEDAILTAFGRFPSSASPSPIPLPSRTPYCAPGLTTSQCEAYAQARADRMQAFRLQTVALQNRGLTPLQIRAMPYGPQRTYCYVPANTTATKLYDKSIGVQDRKRSVLVIFTEMDPDRPCETIATTVATDQTIEGTTAEAQNSVEDEFIKAAKEKFGAPTYFSPRHVGPTVDNHLLENGLGILNGTGGTVAPTVERRMLPPFLAWCDRGTVSDCKTGGQSVHRRLILSVNLANDQPAMEITLEDLQAVRQAKAAITRASLDRSKPQL